ncbi:MAG: HAD family phosphatase [Candidatus Melainabacteria bacterium]|nr:HAD family phosphatase [Candidatus Melainabacteria bacterium]
MKEVKAVIFDYGNVLSLEPYPEDHRSMAGLLDLEVEVFVELYWRFRDDYDRGTSPAHDYWGKIAGAARREIDPVSLAELVRIDVESWSRPRPEMIAWLASIQELGIKAGLLSNMPVDLKENLHGSCQWFPRFDHATFSCDRKCVKPEEAVYRCSIAGIDEDEEEILFLDDRQVNVEAAIKCGIHSLLFSFTPEFFQEAEARFGLPSLALK